MVSDDPISYGVGNDCTPSLFDPSVINHFEAIEPRHFQIHRIVDDSRSRKQTTVTVVDATTVPFHLHDILRWNEEERLYDRIKALAHDAEDNPPFIFGWENLGHFVQAVHQAWVAEAISGVALPTDPLRLPPSSDERQSKIAILDYLHIPGAAARLDTTCLSCTGIECQRVSQRKVMLDMNPFILEMPGTMFRDLERSRSIGYPGNIQVPCEESK